MQNQAFTLEADETISEDIKPHHISSRLVLLTQTFPTLRIIWSSSPYQSAALIASLKQGKKEPLDLSEGSKPHHVAMNEETEAVEQLDLFDPIDVLKRLPGVNSHNVRGLLDRVPNMRALAQLSKLELQKILGKSNGAELHAFLNESLFTASKGKA